MKIQNNTFLVTGGASGLEQVQLVCWLKLVAMLSSQM